MRSMNYLSGMTNLIHLIYASVESEPFTAAALADLLQRSREKNARAGLTGVLVFSEGNFFQVLEGEPAQVGALFDVIRNDPRHGQLVEIIREPVARRAFDGWSMGYLELPRGALGGIEGAELVSGASFRQLSSTRARKLLQAFTNGRWRQAASGQSAA